MENNIREWLTQWFIENLGIEANIVEDNLNVNFFHNSWMDSFQFINFISDVEDEFDVTFSNDEFQDRNFASISGVSKSIASKL